MALASTGSDLKAKEDAHEKIVLDLYGFYTNTVLPIEQAISYHLFHSEPITEGEMRAAPVVLLVGPYSVGKTSFIRYLLGRDFPNMNIGPEPTTDRYSAIMYGPEDRVVPGNTLCVAPMTPFGGCQAFGNGFLTRFEGSMVNSPILKSLTLVDTPGVLSGAKHRERTYDPEAVLEWFAERADMIILILDVYKCDISDEMADTIRILQRNPEKVRVALNKCDAVHQQQLMRVYGAVMWNLAKVLGTPEVCRIYLGSFWDSPPAREETADLLIAEMRDMFRDLGMLPRQAAVRRVNEMVKRCRKVRLLACLLDHLRMEMPKMMGVDSTKKRLLGDMPTVFAVVSQKYQLSAGDFPDIGLFVETAKGMDFKQFPALKGKRLQNGKLLDKLDDGVKNFIPGLLKLLPTTSSVAEVAGMEPPPQIAALEAARAASKNSNGTSTPTSNQQPSPQQQQVKKEESKKAKTKAATTEATKMEETKKTSASPTAADEPRPATQSKKEETKKGAQKSQQEAAAAPVPKTPEAKKAAPPKKTVAAAVTKKAAPEPKVAEVQAVEPEADVKEEEEVAEEEEVPASKGDVSPASGAAAADEAEEEEEDEEAAEEDASEGADAGEGKDEGEEASGDDAEVEAEAGKAT